MTKKDKLKIDVMNVTDVLQKEVAGIIDLPKVKNNEDCKYTLIKDVDSLKADYSVSFMEDTAEISIGVVDTDVPMLSVKVGKLTRVTGVKLSLYMNNLTFDTYLGVRVNFAYTEQVSWMTYPVYEKFKEAVFIYDLNLKYIYSFENKIKDVPVISKDLNLPVTKRKCKSFFIGNNWKNKTLYDGFMSSYIEYGIDWAIKDKRIKITSHKKYRKTA